MCRFRHDFDEISALFRSIALLQGRQGRKRAGSPGRLPAAPRTPRRACGDRDQFPKAEIRWPRHRGRPCHSEASPADRPPRPLPVPPRRALCGASGRNTRSTASSTVLSIGSSVTTQFCTTAAWTRPTTPQPVGAVPHEIEASLEPRQRREARGFGDRRPRPRHPPRYRHAARSPGRPRPRPENSRPARRTFARSSSRNRLRIGKLKLRARQRTRLLPVEPPARLAHIGSQAPGAQRRLDNAEDIAASPPPRAPPHCRRRARFRRPWRGRKMPPRRAAFPWAPARSPTPISRKLSSMSRQNRSNSC